MSGRAALDDDDGMMMITATMTTVMMKQMMKRHTFIITMTTLMQKTTTLNAMRMTKTTNANPTMILRPMTRERERSLREVVFSGEGNDTRHSQQMQTRRNTSRG